MPTVLSLTASQILPGNKIETIFETRDFGYLIDKYMGYEAKDILKTSLMNTNAKLTNSKARYTS